jgi:hypothetical protein
MSRFRILIGVVIALWLAWRAWVNGSVWESYFATGEIPWNFFKDEILPIVVVVAISLIVLRFAKAVTLAFRARSNRLSPAKTEETGVEVNLEPVEQLLLSGRFLSNVATTACVLFWPLGAYLVLLISLVIFSDGLPPAKDVPIASLAVFLAFLSFWLPYYWSHGIAHGKTARVAVVSAIIGGIVAFLGIMNLHWSSVFVVFDGNRHLSTPAGVGLSLMVLAACVAIIAFGLRIASDGLRFSENLLAVASIRTGAAPEILRPPTTTMSAIARAIGIHPICPWLPTASRRLTVGGLFALATFSLAGSLAYLTYIVFRGAPSEVVGMLGSQCYAVPERFYSCFGWPLGMFGVAVVGLTASATVRLLAHRLSRISLEQLRAVDPRPPVLFLRSFSDDQVALKKPRRPIWHRLFEIGDGAKKLDRLLLEEATEVGPVIAIGMPGHPPPFGAARVYTAGAEWQAAIKELCKQACAVVIVIDRTPGVLWEVAHITEAGHTGKTLFLVAPNLVHSVASVGQELADVLPKEWKSTEPLLANERRVLVGWYEASDHSNSLLTAHETSWLSYLSALRVRLSQ